MTGNKRPRVRRPAGGDPRELVPGLLRPGPRPQPDRGRRDRHACGNPAAIVAVLVTAALCALGRRLTRHPDRGTFVGLAAFFVLLAGDEPVWLLSPEQSRFCSDRSARGANRRQGCSVVGNPQRVECGGLSSSSYWSPLRGMSSPTALPSDRNPRPGRGDRRQARHLRDPARRLRPPRRPRDVRPRRRPVCCRPRDKGLRRSGPQSIELPHDRARADQHAQCRAAFGPRDHRSSPARAAKHPPRARGEPGVSILADHGYETIAFSSGYELVALRSANRFVDTGQLNELEVGLAELTILEPLMDALTGDLKASTIRARAMAMVPAVRSLAAEASESPSLRFRPLSAAPPTVRVRFGLSRRSRR